MTSAPLKPPKQARKKVTTDLGRQLLSRERQRLSREQASLAEQQLAEAERRRTQQRRNVKSVKPLDIAISRSIVKRFAGVLASEGVNVRITATPSVRTSAWTDFEQIVLNYAPQDDEVILAATMRALAYHEGGHCRFTLPFLQLAEAAGIDSPNKALHGAWNSLEDQRMETAVVSDSPRKAAYFTPMILIDFVSNVNLAAANWPLLVWRKYLPTKIRAGARKLFVHQHNLMGLDGETVARSIEAITTTYVLADNAVTMWEAVVEYHALLQTIAPIAGLDDAAMGHDRQYKREDRNLDDFLIIPVAGDMIDAGTVDIDEADESDTVETIEEFLHIMGILWALLNGQDVLPPVIYAQISDSKSESAPADAPQPQGEKDSTPGDDSSKDESKGNDSKDDERTPTGADDDGLKFADERKGDADDDNDTPGGSVGEHKNTGLRDDLDYKPEDEEDEEADDEEDELDELEAEEDEDDDEADTDLSDEDLSDVLADANDHLISDPTLKQDVQSLHDAINNRTSDLMPYVAGVSTDTEAKAAADSMALDIEQAFQEATVDKAPGWVEGQRRGVVNVLRYTTRQPADVEFFRQYIDTDAPGDNIAVSVLLDYSYSMNTSVKGLAQAGYATKVACDNLNIPCTVILWDTSATVLWDAMERAESLPVIVAAGGTDPTIAVSDLDRQRYGKDIHIVIIMTDGAWGSNTGTPGFLASYKGEAAGRYFIGLGYCSNGYGSGPAEQMADNLRRYGCDEAHGISNLLDIPKYLEQSLIRFS